MLLDLGLKACLQTLGCNRISLLVWDDDPNGVHGVYHLFQWFSPG